VNAYAEYTDHNITQVDLEGKWESSDESVATVDQNEVVTWVGPGQAYIYFNYGGLKDSVWIRNVKPNLLFSNSPNVMLEPNKSKDVAIYALFGFVPRIGVNLFEVTNQVKWTVSDESVATISADGHIIAH